MVGLQVIRRGNRGRDRLRQPLTESLEVHEEERLVPAVVNLRYPDRTAYGKPVLVEGQLGTPLTGAVLKEIVGVQFVVAKKFVQRAVQQVRAGLDPRIHHRART